VTFTDQQKAALESPLDRAKVKGRDQGGRTVSYIEGWHAIAEANRIFGFDGWQRTTTRLEETNRDLVNVKKRDGTSYEQWRVGYLAMVEVRVGDVVRQGTGFGSGMSKPEALGEAIESAAKEAETDAMKRALMTFGNPFGLALYDKEQRQVADMPPEPSAADLYVDECHRKIRDFKDKKTLSEWWRGERQVRIDFGLDSEQVRGLTERVTARGVELEPNIRMAG
jgi:DNA repair and recombination protein RAD52